MGTSSSSYRFAIHEEVTTTYFNREAVSESMARSARWFAHFHRLPQDRWVNAAQACDILRGHGVPAHVRTLQHLLKAAALKEAGVIGRNIGFTNRKEYKFYDVDAFIAYHTKP